MSSFLASSGDAGPSRLSPDDDDEDNDICPVCDGDCTCNNRSHALPTPILSSANARYVTTTPSDLPGRISGVQSLKIKLIVPPGMPHKTRLLATPSMKHREDGLPPRHGGAGGSSITSFSGPGLSHHADSSSTVGRGSERISSAPKRRGRPLKSSTTSKFSAPSRLAQDNEAVTLPRPQSHLQSLPSRSSGTKGTHTLPKGSGQQNSNIKASRRIPRPRSGASITWKSNRRGFLAEAVDSDLDLDDESIDTARDRDGDTSPGHFPTFLPADELVSTASDSSESDSAANGFGSDSSLEAEEESYIIAEQRRHDRARVRRELLGDDCHKHKDSHNNWVIRPRKRSVGLSDVDMDGDSDNATEDEDDEEEVDEGEDEDETDGQASRLVYSGVATGWSDDEESHFDADLFFANLSDTTEEHSSDEEDGIPPVEDAGTTANGNTNHPHGVDFEVTEAWDGQVIFTNGFNDGHGVLDVAFEATASQRTVSDSTSVSYDSDIEMRIGDSEDDDADANSEVGDSGGDTADEGLIDERGLPTSRAMSLFRWPASVSAINPLSTVSPSCSPAPRNQHASRSWLLLESPRPADILAGKAFFDPPDDLSPGSAEGSRLSSPRVAYKGGVPIMGQFAVDSNTPQRTAVLTGTNKDVPSPFPLRQRRRRYGSNTGSFSSVSSMALMLIVLSSECSQWDLRDRTTKLSLCTPSLPPPSDEPSTETTSNVALGDPIPLDDVLDSTFIGSDSETSAQPVIGGESELPKDAQNLHRWDRIPVGAFRLTRDSAVAGTDVPTSPGWTSEAPKSVASDVLSYEHALRSSPLGTILWQDRSIMRGGSRRPKTMKDRAISPVLLRNDGSQSPHRDSGSNRRQQQNYKNRKGSRREMKVSKHKGRGPVHQPHHQQHFRHNHHSNMKTRSTGSLQRTNFYSSPTSIPTLNV